VIRERLHEFVAVVGADADAEQRDAGACRLAHAVDEAVRVRVARVGQTSESRITGLVRPG
jgi:hypothetical protein